MLSPSKNNKLVVSMLSLSLLFRRLIFHIYYDGIPGNHCIDKGNKGIGVIRKTLNHVPGIVLGRLDKNVTRFVAAPTTALGFDGLDLIVRNLHLIRERDRGVRERDERVTTDGTTKRAITK
jgi:hypothetical protein